MKRLTSDDTKSIFYSLNLFFAKDNEVWIRGGGPEPDYQDCTLVNWIGRVADKHNLEIYARNAEDLGDEMYDCLQDGIDTIEGIVALLHAAAVQAATMRSYLKNIEDILGDDYDLDRLKELVQADREGRLFEAPFKIGTRVFDISDGQIDEYEVIGFSLGDQYINLFPLINRENCDDILVTAIEVSEGGEILFQFVLSEIGETVFLYRKEAEAALKKMNEGYE